LCRKEGAGRGVFFCSFCGGSLGSGMVGSLNGWLLFVLVLGVVGLVVGGLELFFFVRGVFVFFLCLVLAVWWEGWVFFFLVGAGLVVVVLGLFFLAHLALRLHVCRNSLKIH